MLDIKALAANIAALSRSASTLSEAERKQRAENLIEEAVAGAECNTVIELKPEHHAALPWHFA